MVNNNCKDPECITVCLCVALYKRYINFEIWLYISGKNQCYLVTKTSSISVQAMFHISCSQQLQLTSWVSHQSLPCCGRSCCCCCIFPISRLFFGLLFGALSGYQCGDKVPNNRNDKPWKYNGGISLVRRFICKSVFSRQNQT